MGRRVVDVVTLDLAGHGEVRLAVDHQVQQDVRPTGGVQQVEHLTSVDRQRHGLRAVTVETPPARGPPHGIPCHALAVVVAMFRFQLGVHERVLEEYRGSAAYRTG